MQIININKNKRVKIEVSREEYIDLEDDIIYNRYIQFYQHRRGYIGEYKENIIKMCTDLLHDTPILDVLKEFNNIELYRDIRREQEELLVGYKVEDTELYDFLGYQQDYNITTDKIIEVTEKLTDKIIYRANWTGYSQGDYMEYTLVANAKDYKKGALKDISKYYNRVFSGELYNIAVTTEEKKIYQEIKNHSNILERWENINDVLDCVGYIDLGEYKNEEQYNKQLQEFIKENFELDEEIIKQIKFIEE